jgi:hypothetical protein|tara:strand:- start:274 stop:534 length:261 start_codon:yes stop_codon:yes gene_type:complete
MTLEKDLGKDELFKKAEECEKTGNIEKANYYMTKATYKQNEEIIKSNSTSRYSSLASSIAGPISGNCFVHGWYKGKSCFCGMIGNR